MDVNPWDIAQEEAEGHDNGWFVVEAADVDPVDVPEDEPTHEEVQALYAADPMWQEA